MRCVHNWELADKIKCPYCRNNKLSDEIDNQMKIISLLVKRIEALEAEMILKKNQQPIPQDIIKTLIETKEVLAQARRLDWVNNIGI